MKISLGEVLVSKISQQDKQEWRELINNSSNLTWLSVNL